MIKIIIGVIACMFIVFVGFMLIDPSLGVGNGGNGSYQSENETTLNVSVEGEVKKTGTYSLPEGSTIYDLITKAGGVTDNADELAYFETSELTKGMTYYIAPKYDNSDVCSVLPITKVNINSDDAEEISDIANVTSTIANSIVSYRIENGDFYTIEDLTNVYGIGTATYRKMRNYVTLHD